MTAARPAMRPTLSAERLREVLLYDPETGIALWRVKKGRSNIGDIAGGIDCFGYRVVGIDGRTYRLHRLAIFYMTGEWPPHQVDHRDLDKANNRWLNLRKATQSQNGANKPVQINNTSGFKGVRKHKFGGKWRAEIKINGERRHLGVHYTREEAATLYAAAAHKNFGEFARLG